MAINDTDQMLVNEVQKMERAIDARTKALAMMQQAQPSRRLPKRYTVDIEWDAGDLQQQANSFDVVADCRHFDCQALTFTLLAVGTTQTGAGTQGTVPPEFISATMPFMWRVLETSRNRLWQNGFLPWTLLGGGHLQPRLLPVPARLPAGTQVSVEAKPQMSLASPTGVPFSAVSRYRLQVAFIGVEVLL
jgi:hypothetical protein